MSVRLAARLWTYQAERFPLGRTAALLAVFTAASINVSAVLAGRELPGWGGYAAGFVIGLVLFFQLRVCDEFKDQEDDMRHRPERPIPRGLVSLRLIGALGLVSVPLAIAAAWAWSASLLWLLALVWLWLAAMSFEFGAPAWLRARPVVYLVSHMAIMPLIDLLMTGIEWLPHGGPPGWLVLFLALSFVNGCVLELGRKIWAPESERNGVDSYSRHWGPKRAVLVWACCVALAFALLVGLGAVTGFTLVLAAVGGAGCLACFWTGRRYWTAPTVQNEKRLDAIAGLWVLLCYGAAGFVPPLFGAV
jgi:4-hydroxybenzoate polyprenyltransferase